MSIQGTINNVSITGMACAVPLTRVGNTRFVDAFGQEQMSKFEKMVGVVERRVSDSGETTADLAIAAAEALQKRTNLRLSCKDVDAVLFVSQTPNHVLPATAFDIQRRLGIKRDAIVLDINLGCSGFVYGIFMAASLLKMDGVGKVLLCGGDTITKLTNPSDAASAPLFGDAGFAAILCKDSNANPIHYAFMSDGVGANVIEANHGGCLCMDGMEVFNFTINEAEQLVAEQMSQLGLNAEQIDYLVLHQANKFVLKQVAMMTGFTMNKVPLSMDRYGNTSSASIPLTLCDMKVRTPDLSTKKVLMSGFGVGLSWGTLVTDFDFCTCFGIVNGSE